MNTGFINRRVSMSGPMASAAPEARPRRGRLSFTGVPPKVRWLILLSAPQHVAGGFFFVVVSAYLPEIGLGSDLVGLILGLSGISMVASAVPLGLFSDRRGRKGLLLAGSAAVPGILFLFAFTRDAALLILGGLVVGVGEAAFLATWNALIADGTPLEARDEAFSLSFIVGTTTVGLGFVTPLALPAISAQTGLDSHALHQIFLILYGLLATATPLGYVGLLRGHVETIRPKMARGKPRNLGLLLKFSGINGLIGLGAGFIIPLIPTWLFLKFAMTDAFSGPLLAVSSLVMGVAAFGSPVLAKRWGPIVAIVTTQAASTFFMLSLAFVPDPFLAGALYTVRAALMNMGIPILDSYLMSIITPEERGFASALNSIIWRLPNSVSTVVGGVLLAAGEFQLPFFLATGLYSVAIVLFYAVFRNVTPQPPTSAFPAAH
jgi:MFS family permease